MSRVDDDRQAQRAAERLLLEKRQQEERAQKKQQGESAFAKLVSQSAQDKTLQQKQGQTRVQDAQMQHGDEEVTEAGAHLQDDASLLEHADQKNVKTRRQGAAFTDKLKQSRAGEGERASESRLSDFGKEGMAAQGRTGDQRAGETRAESRRQDAQSGRDALSDRGEGALKGGAQQGAARAGKGELKADADGGGKGQSGGGKDQGGSSNLGAGFRFNPALMAPVPVAKPRENTGSDRLRALANEIAQKIVERVRVGTNAKGMAEFQIDLRSNVLAGLSIKVSGGNGKIRAVFSGNDREVLKLLQENADGLKQALGGRGLALEELRIEERA